MIFIRRVAVLIVGSLFVLLGGSPSAPSHAQSIVMASTTSLQDSGMLEKVLPLFTSKTGVAVRVIAQGTGQALATASRGDADIVLVHDPEAEDKFIAEGHGSERRQIAWNDFVIVGPGSDPAHIAGGKDVLAALRAIETAHASFVSRGDKSGTDALEKRLWKAVGHQPSLAAGDGWYRDIGGGMGAALNAASGVNAYTLSDRGTWLSFKNRGELKILLEGDTRLLNRYDVILLNPATHPNAKHETARSLRDWLISSEGQAAIGDYTKEGQQLFHPSATSPK